MKIEGTFHDKTTTPEYSEDRTAVPSMTESELYVCTQRVSTVHTHSFKGLQSSVTKPTNTEYTSTRPCTQWLQAIEAAEFILVLEVDCPAMKLALTTKLQ